MWRKQPQFFHIKYLVVVCHIRFYFIGGVITARTDYIRTRYTKLTSRQNTVNRFAPFEDENIVL
ncbi:MAG: hypothetical protein PHU52_06540 [Dehalococcoidales bacterium]|nr:hypothetical protein [Dehalococcoidales bacterium]